MTWKSYLEKQISQMQVPLDARREPAGDQNIQPKVPYFLDIKLYIY